MKRRQLHFLSPTYLSNRTGFHSNNLGNLKRFLVFYSPPLFAGLENPFWAIANLAHLFFAKDRQKTKELNSNRTTKWCAFSTVLRVSRPLSQRRFATAYGNLFSTLT